MNYTKAVSEGKRLINRSEVDQWRLAELTFEVVEGGKSRAQWGKDIGLARTTIGTYYRVWAKWGVRPALQRPVFAHACNAIHDGSDEPLTRAESQGRREARQVPTRPEDRIELAVKLLADEDVSAAVVRNTKAMSQIANAEQGRVDDNRSQQTRSATRPMADEWDVSGDLFKSRKLIVSALKKAKAAGRTTKAIRQSWLDDAADVRVALEWFESLVADGDTSWEQALAEWSEA